MASKDRQREEIRLKKEIGKLGISCYNSFYTFFKTFWPEMSGETYIDAKHIEYICNRLQSEAMPVINQQRCMKTIVINVPPGSSKSTIATIAFPAWLWLRRPQISTANISYSSALSMQHAWKARDIVGGQKWNTLFNDLLLIKYGKPLEIIKMNKNEMLNNFKGNRFNTSVDGSILGMHADILIKDDLTSAAQAASEAEREHANEWNDNTTITRRKNPSCYLDIYIGQRLHENDICGHVLSKNIDITHICLPAEITSSTPVIPAEAISLYTNGILDPIRRPKDVLENIKIEMGSNAYSGQFMQTPFNLEEQDIKPSMFKKIHEKDIPPDAVFDMWIDGAFTEKTENDPTGIDIVSRYKNDIIWKKSYDIWKKQPDVMKFIKGLVDSGIFDPMNGRIFIEPKASGITLADALEADTDYNVVRIGEHNKQESKIVQAGKKARHEIIKPKAESGRITVVEDTWNESSITQICGYPRAAHDEHVDNIGYAINHYYLNESTFIKEWVLEQLSKQIVDYIPVSIDSARNKNKLISSYKEDDKGDVKMYDFPVSTHNYRYICVCSLMTEQDRNGNTTILVLDRLTNAVSLLFESNDIDPKKAGYKALEIAFLYDAKLVYVVRKEIGQRISEEYDLSNIAIKEARNLFYDKLYSRLSMNTITKKREREYGFELNAGTRREVFYNLKDILESRKIRELPAAVFNQLSLIERKKEDGSVMAKEGFDINTITAFAVALKVHDEMWDKVIEKRY